MSLEKQKWILFLINAANVSLRFRSGTEGMTGLASQCRSLSGLASPWRLIRPIPRRALPAAQAPAPRPGPAPASPPQPPPAPPCRCPGESPGSCWACGKAGCCREQPGAPERGQPAAAARRYRPWLGPSPTARTQRRSGGPAPAETRSRGFGSGPAHGRRPAAVGCETWAFGHWYRWHSGE